MSFVTIPESIFGRVKGKNIIITGGSAGIGEATTRLLHGHGAIVTLGDRNEKSGQALADSLENVHFIRCDVSSWDSCNALFKSASAHGPIDIVISNAGMVSHETLFEDEFSPETGDLLPPNMPDVAVNLFGPIYVARLAIHYFRKQRYGRLVFTGSTASYVDTPPIWLYTTAKHGVLGLMRAMRGSVQGWGDITVNLVAPWLTMTAMGTHLKPKWGDRPTNAPESVAGALIFAAVGTEWREGGVNGEQKVGAPVNGCGFWVGGDQVVEFEKGLRDTRSQWIGPEFGPAMDEGQKALGGW